MPAAAAAEQELPLAISWQRYTALPFLLLVQLYLYLPCCVYVCVCAAILCALFGLTFHFALRLAFCGLTAAVSAGIGL